MKKILPFLLFIFALSFNAQVISSSKWSDLFSYNNVLAIREDNGKLIAATENGIFYYTPATGELSKLSKANGLHEVKISAFDYNPETKIGLVGYANGSMDVITPEGITYVVDIPIASGYAGDKKINHISISGNLAVISVGYGVSIFKLDKKEFAESSFFLVDGIYEAAREAVIKGDLVYVVTAAGLKSHEMNVTFPIFSTWNPPVATGNFTQISGNSVIAYANTNTVKFGDGSSFVDLPKSFTDIRDVVVTAQNIIVADANVVSVFNLSGAFVKSYDAGEYLNTAFYSDSKIYAATKVSGIKNEAGDSLKPDGPYNNTSYKIDVKGNQIVISTGGRDSYNNPIYRNLGYYHFNGTEWIYPDLFKNSNVPYNVLDAVINPSKPSEIFFTNYTPYNGSKGIYKMGNNILQKIYASTGGWENRSSGVTFDENNQLFVSSMANDGKIGFYYYSNSLDNFILVNVVTAGGSQKPIAKDGMLFIPAAHNNNGGLLIYDYRNTPTSLSDDRFKILKKSNNLPSNGDGVVSVAVDKNDDIWIGARAGLRIISNPSSIISEDNPQTNPIIIEENGLGEELFRDSSVLQIEVDAGNQKWISIDGGGVFYMNSTGEQTLKHFTKENSPLPSNSVTDIKVDNTSGKVYFVTLDGVMVYQGDVLDVSENFGDVLVYPNPVVYSKYKGNVNIRGLAEKTNIRITDAAGNLVHQAVSRGGYYEWNLNNQRGVRVASGIYFVLMTNSDGTDTATAKIAVVN